MKWLTTVAQVTKMTQVTQMTKMTQVIMTTAMTQPTKMIEMMKMTMMTKTTEIPLHPPLCHITGGGLPTRIPSFTRGKDGLRWLTPPRPQSN
jgi:phosphoribosylaminoimidazole (AIR) synthetase